MAKNKKEMTPEERLAAALVPEEEQPYELPKGWKWVYWGKCGEFIAGTGFPKAYQGLTDRKYPFYKVGSLRYVDADGCLTDNQHTIDDDVLIKLKSKKVGPHAIVFAKIGEAIRLNRRGLTKQDCCIDNNMMAFQADKDLLSYQYAYFWSLGLDLYKYTNATTVPAIRKTDLEKIIFPLPSLSEQWRIVTHIESMFAKLDAAKEKVQAVLDAHETRKAALLHEAIAGNLIGAGEKELKPLSEIVDLIRIGPFGSALHKEDYIQGGIPVVNPQHIVNQVICPDSRKSISESKADSLAVYKMCVNDIIIGRRGEMGRTAPVGEDEAGWLCGTGCMLLRLKKEYDAKFYSLVIASQKSKQYLETHAVGSTMKNLNEKIIRNLPVPVYSYAEQQEIVAVLDRLLGREEEVRQSAESVLAAIDSMKQSILARAFRGELVV